MASAGAEAVELRPHGRAIGAEHADFDIVAGLHVRREHEGADHMVHVVAGRAVEGEALQRFQARLFAQQFDREAPAEPMVFYKTPTSLIGPGETIIRPKGTAKLDAEGELVIIIKDRCRNVSKADAMKHVLGYTCGNDVSARDWQKDDRNWWRAKSADTFSPAGPYMETELDPHNVRLICRINGKDVQNESTTYLIFDIPTIIEFTSKYVTLEPGDMIYTGTPGEPGEMNDGDVCEVEIEGIGTLSNPIKLES